MILGAEIAMLVMGFVLLIRGKGIGKDALPHWQYRVLGGFLLTCIPVAFLLVLVLGIVWAMTHPEIESDHLSEEIRWPAVAVELVTVGFYALVGTLWEKMIKKKALAESQA